ncbi:hypothetical protein [Hymenobacter sp. GOD-10R]|uniref:hypothetical protein n=1 Tax=Hymenobacter sp. GOD-10R TaxID=3093922 RepID=UPI002D79AC3E|nr:hypothetical protein [Hymenobacter sp. GOD-10R]WRQ31945.1 hypothetical protein SD425_29470 [Hymenobacter sp. GOD-10R]
MQFGPYGSLAIDLLVWAAKETYVPNFRERIDLLFPTPTLTFHAADFYNLFGHVRNSVLKPLTPGGEAIFAYRDKHRKDYGRCILDAVLYSMSTNSIAYAEKEYRVVDERRRTRYTLSTLKVFKGLTIERSSRAYVRYTMQANPDFVQNNHLLSQVISVPDYVSLRTAGTEHSKRGSSWMVGRFLYLRMRYAWGLWCTAENKGKAEFTENFDELLEIAGFVKTPPKKAASLLRGYLSRVCTLDSIPFTARIEKGSTQNARRQQDGSRPDVYRVILTKKTIQRADEDELHRVATEQQQEVVQQRLQNLAQNMRSQ